MADVKIVDIDNVQWNMKDQEARNKITTLEKRVHIVEEDMQSQNKYRQWSDNILEQWFTVTTEVSTDKGFHVDYPKTFDDVPFEINAFIKGTYSQSPIGWIVADNNGNTTKSGIDLVFKATYDYQDITAKILISVKGIKTI